MGFDELAFDISSLVAGGLDLHEITAFPANTEWKSVRDFLGLGIYSKKFLFLDHHPNCQKFKSAFP